MNSMLQYLKKFSLTALITALEQKANEEKCRQFEIIHGMPADSITIECRSGDKVSWKYLVEYPIQP